jgi:hypothetical protein
LKRRVGRGRSVAVGSGSDWSEVPVFRVQPATLDARVVPGCPPGPAMSAVAEVGLELAPDGVADASLQCSQRFLLALAFGQLAVVVDAAGGGVGDLGDGGCRAWFRVRFPRGFNRCLFLGPLDASMGAVPL